jgi:tetratricopeptide (TPR) repeat protein
VKTLFRCLILLNPCYVFATDGTECDRVRIFNETAQHFLYMLPDSAFLYANRALQLAEQAKCSEGAANSHHLIGMVFYHQGVYQEAITHLNNAEEIFKQLNDKKNHAENLNQLGLVYYNIKQPELALEEHEKALALYKELKDENGIAFSYGCLGHLYEKRKSYDKALSYQQQALTYYEKSSDQLGMATILENIGSIYEDQENYSVSLDYFTKAFKLNESTRDSLSMIVNINNIGDNYRKTNQYDQAIAWTKKAAELAARLKDKYQLSSAYKDLSKIYNLVGDYENAYKNLEIGRNLYQDMYTQDASRQLALFQTLFEIERKNHSIQQLESDQKISSIVKITMGSSFALIAMLAGVVISRQRLKIKRDKDILDQAETKNKLMLAEVENTHLHEQRLQQELDTKSKALTSHTLHIISKNKMLEDIQQKLTDFLKEANGDQRKPIKSLVKMIEHNFVQDKDWEDFRQIFEQVHQDFFKRLQRVANELTPAELRLAALIKLNVPSKDIAVVLGISQDSLRIARYRLRKKLNLEQGDNLIRYIGSL